MEVMIRNEAQFVSNNRVTNTIVLKELQNELLNCESFTMSVAFITEGGLTMILQQLKELEERGIQGRILTSEYNHFNNPKVFKRLATIPNVEVKVYTESAHHTKGYIFTKKDKRTVLIGSSNLTQSALKTNREWNLKIEKTEDSKVIEDLSFEFEDMWQDATVLSDAWIASYAKKYFEAKELRSSLKKIEAEVERVMPNSMQVEALRNLDHLRKSGAQKALLISATGTGKTYLSAFDVRNFKAKKTLFIIHREQIAKAAARTFKKVMQDKTVGIFSGNTKETDRDIVFTTIQTLHKSHSLEIFDKDHFDYIIYDEAHRSEAKTYQKVMDYFKPQFMLGMTATPIRTDGTNVAALFDYNIAHEIHLKDALAMDMLIPFHYFGVSDVNVDGEVIHEKSEIAALVSDHRVDAIIKESQYFGFSGDKLKGLIFCSRNQEASLLSQKLNSEGYNTLALDGNATLDERETAIARLTSNEGDLDYIITVDIFGEGVDIPEINQIIMLRPTESAIVFVQQLGRGLRKHAEKDYLVVIDFIGNYKNNFMIPIALSGDNSYSKNKLRKFVMEGNTMIPGESTIELDRVSKEKIYEAINQQNFSSHANIRKEYTTIKNKLGKIPYPIDFILNNGIDLDIVFSNLKTKIYCYHELLLKFEPEYKDVLSDTENDILNFITHEFSNGKRLEELRVLERLKTNISISMDVMHQVYGSIKTQSIINYLSLNFVNEVGQKRYHHVSLISIQDGMLSLSNTFLKALENPVFVKHFNAIVAYGVLRMEKYYETVDEYGFVLWQQYTRKDASWLLNWESNQEGTINGYKIDHTTKTIPLFVTYNKAKNINDSIRYEDQFVDRDTMHWMSKNNRTLSSTEIQNIIHAQAQGYTIFLFVQRDETEKTKFYYLGEVTAHNPVEKVMQHSKNPVVEFELKLKNPVRDDLYYYLIEGWDLR